MVMISGFSLPAKARHYIQYLYSVVCVFPDTNECTHPLDRTKPLLSQAEALSYVFQHVTKKRMCQNIDTPSFLLYGINRIVD